MQNNIVFKHTDLRKSKIQRLEKHSWSRKSWFTMCYLRSLISLPLNISALDQYHRDVLQDLKSDPKDDYLSLLRETIKCLTRPEKYFEKTLRLAINKLSTDEWALTRVVVTQAEVNMQCIKEEYHKRNSVPLERAIAGDTSGDYENLLLALIGHEDA